MMNKDAWIKRLHEEGFEDIRICPIEVNFDSGEHMHDEHTVHVILSGELTIMDKEGIKTYKQGDKVEFPAGTRHSAKSKSGGIMLIGVKRK